MLQTKALYNLLRLNAAEDKSLDAEDWMLEDMRSTSIEDLFSRLEKYGIKLDRRNFVYFASNCDIPEELFDFLLPDEASDKIRDPFYLIIFELWRRLLPEKQSLSIFCDELDHRIFLYDQGKLDSDEAIQDVLANLLEVLDENADTGADPEEILKAVSEYCAHEIESFICDYISDLLDSGNSLYALELIEGFSPYGADPHWFDFLRMRIVAFTDIGEANIAMYRLLENELDISLLFELIRFLVANGEHELFKIAVKKVIPLLSSPEELLEIMMQIVDFYRRLDEDEKEKEVQKIINSRTIGPICSKDLKIIEELISE